MAVIRDPNHPDFPHGTTQGHSRGCRCDPCEQAEYRQGKQARLRKARHGNTRRIDPAKVAQAADHMHRLVEQVPGLSITAIANATGSHDAIFPVFRREAGASLSLAAYGKIMALTAADLAGAATRVPSERTIWHIRTMQALGYSMRWQEINTGVTLRNIFARRQKFVEPQVAAVVAELARRVGDTPATPDVVPGARSVSVAKAIAARNGFYPPAFYDEDGTLDYRSIPDHPWSKAEELCHRRIERLDLMLRHPDLAEGHLSRMVDPDSSERDLVRIRGQFVQLFDRLRLRASHEGSDERRQELIPLVRAFYAGQGDPVGFAIDNNLIDPTSSAIPENHPAMVEREEELAHIFEARQQHRAKGIQKAIEANARRKAARQAAQAGEAA